MVSSKLNPVFKSFACEKILLKKESQGIDVNEILRVEVLAA